MSSGLSLLDSYMHTRSDNCTASLFLKMDRPRIRSLHLMRTFLSVIKWCTITSVRFSRKAYRSRNNACITPKSMLKKSMEPVLLPTATVSDSPWQSQHQIQESFSNISVRRTPSLLYRVALWLDPEITCRTDTYIH